MKTFVLIGLLGAALPALASEDFDAASFIANKCSGCHDTRVYTRPDHRMHNRQQLEAQVRRCDANIGTTLFNEDIDKLVDYLDRQYYHFDK
jgi:hypothetical protein